MWSIPAIIAVLIFSFALFVFPVLSSVLISRRRNLSTTGLMPKKIDIVIPCHNEEKRLSISVESVELCIREMQRLYPTIDVQLMCGIDDCSDGTAEEARKLNVNVKTFGYRSKWKVINDIIIESKSDWVVLLDAGVTWDFRLLRNSISLLADPDVVSFSPGYRKQNSSLVSRLYWRVEAFLKSFENLAGGPISVHGATVFYRTAEAKKALRVLAGRRWINDDVALPLIMRTIIRDGTIVYSSNERLGFCVCDTAPRAAKEEAGARLRVAFGNLQWIRRILPVCWYWNRDIAFLSLRRVIRLFWAIAALCFVLSVSLLFSEIIDNQFISSLGAFFVGLLLIASLRKIPGFVASLRAFISVLDGYKIEGDSVSWS